MLRSVRDKTAEHVQMVEFTYWPAFLTDPAMQSISRDGWKNVWQIMTTLCWQLTLGRCVVVVGSISMSEELSELLNGSRTVMTITTASMMPGIPLTIHAHRQPWQSDSYDNNHGKYDAGIGPGIPLMIHAKCHFWFLFIQSILYGTVQ